MRFKEAVKPTTKKVISSILLAAAISVHILYSKGMLDGYYTGWWGLITEGIFVLLYYPLYLYATILPMSRSGDIKYDIIFYPNIWTYILFVLGLVVYAYIIVCILSLIIGKFKRKQA